MTTEQPQEAELVSRERTASSETLEETLFRIGRRSVLRAGSFAEIIRKESEHKKLDGTIELSDVFESASPRNKDSLTYFDNPLFSVDDEDVAAEILQNRETSSTNPLYRHATTSAGCDDSGGEGDENDSNINRRITSTSSRHTFYTNTKKRKSKKSSLFSLKALFRMTVTSSSN